MPALFSGKLWLEAVVNVIFLTHKYIHVMASFFFFYLLDFSGTKVTVPRHQNCEFLSLSLCVYGIH